MLNPLRNQRGQAMVAIGMGMLAFLAMTVVAVDIGRLAFTATEVQTAADAAATAGATAMLKALGANPGDPDTAKSNAHDQGVNVAQSNSVNGQIPSPDGITVLSGNYNPSADPGSRFTPDGTPLNAVQAIIAQTVPNIVAPVFGDAFVSTTVTKQATAVLSSVTRTTPQLPLIVTTCPPFDVPPDCGNPPSAVIQMGSFNRDSPDSNAWTSYTDPFSNDPDVYQYLPTQCSNGAISGGGQPMPVLTTNPSDSPSLNFFQGIRPLSLAILNDCVANQGIDTFTVAMMPCSGNPASWNAPAGFGTFRISNVVTTNPQSMDIQLLCNAGVTATTGSSVGSSTGADFGTGFVTMAE